MIGMVAGRVRHPLLHIWTALVVIGSLILFLTEQINFPEPYDNNLQNKHLQPELAEPLENTLP
jgi:hypothetical protein